MNSIFSGSYPPGAANDPFAPYNQDDPPCAVCGNFEEHCICPECSTCGSVGDPNCYADPPAHFHRRSKYHGMVRTFEQIESLIAAEKRWAEENRDD